jgi:rhamnosyl/mannosyltransferase
MPTAEMGWLLARPKSKLIVRYQCDVVRQATAMRFYRPFQQRFLSQAEVIMPTSELYARSSEALRPWKAKWRIVPLGIEPEKFEASPEAVRKVQERFGKTFVLFSGVHRYYKGLDYLVRAAKDIQAPLVIAGDGFERPKLMALAEAEGASIHFPGVLGEEELAAYLQACTVFVFPSSARTEAFGISMLEAQAAGKPVVATKLGTGVELVNLDGVTGINVPPQDPQAIAAAVNKLLADAELRDRMGAEAKARVEREFRADRLARQEFELYQEVLARPAP